MRKKHTVFQTPFFSVEEHDEATADGEPYYTIKEADSVIILALDSHDNFLFVRQFRHSVGEDSMELPAGGIDWGETPRQAAKRELLEEAGVHANMIELPGPARMNLNRMQNAHYMFFGLICGSLGRQSSEPSVVPQAVARSDAWEMVQAGRLCHSAFSSACKLTELTLEIDLINSTYHQIKEAFEKYKKQGWSRL